LADICSGYRNPNFEKFTEMVVYFSEKVQPLKPTSTIDLYLTKPKKSRSFRIQTGYACEDFGNCGNFFFTATLSDRGSIL